MDLSRQIIPLACLALAGCTLTPKVVPAPAVATYSGNSANGGLINLGPGGKGPALVTADWVAAYNTLVRKYGKDMTPPDRPNDGVTELPDGTFTVDLQHLSDKNVMATLERSGFKP